MGGKKGKSGGLGRALIRQHNQLVQQTKEKGRALHLQQKRFLESVTEVSDIDAVLEQAEEAGRVFSMGNPAPNVLINLDERSGISDMIPQVRRQQQIEEEALHASSLRVPRRPPWTAKMSVEELDSNEKEAFLVWRRNLARLEENEKLVLTPFEKNLDIWRQLWRVIERSDLLVMVVDSRDPLFYRCPDLETYTREIDEHKRTMLLVNKADLLPFSIRQRWAKYFNDHGILYAFWSAKAASAAMEGKKLSSPWEGGNPTEESDTHTKIYGRDELLARLQTEAEAIVASRGSSSDTGKHFVVGFVGYPNVGKSSTINALVGAKRTGVTSTPGKTKHFQTLIISDELILCDCPGLVFPSFSSSRHEMVASGVLPIDRLTEQREAVQVVASRVSRDALEEIYNITLPKPKPYEPRWRPPSAAELLRAYCSSRGHVSSRGLPDETRAARRILKDYIDGKLPHFELPPGTAESTELNVMSGLGGSSTLEEEEEEEEEEGSDNTDSEVQVAGVDGKEKLDDMLDDMESFDLAGRLLSKTAAATRKKAPAASHKHHMKAQRRKDRSWRVVNNNGDGMPVVRVFQKPAVNFEALKASN